MRTIIIFISILITLSACSSLHKKRVVLFQVDSNPRGAQVDIDGISYGVTPVTIKLELSESYRGLINGGGYNPTGREAYNITLYPPLNSQKKLFSQTKIIRPASAPDGGKLFFNLELDKINPRNRVDLKIDR